MQDSLNKNSEHVYSTSILKLFVKIYQRIHFFRKLCFKNIRHLRKMLLYIKINDFFISQAKLV